MQYTPAQIKNLMRRGLRLLIDPEPSREEKAQVREHFRHHCAYCGTQLLPGEGDIDHLVSAALGGSNALANRVLSCKPCNAQEKRDRDWMEFLQAKADSPSTFQERKSRIESWIAQNGGAAILGEKVLAILAEEAQRTTAEYDRACARIRSSAE